RFKCDWSSDVCSSDLSAISLIFCPEDTPEVNVSEIALQGAAVYRVNGLIDDCGKIVAEGKAKVGWFDTSTLKEPYRIEGKKTMEIGRASCRERGERGG